MLPPVGASGAYALTISWPASEIVLVERAVSTLLGRQLEVSDVWLGLPGMVDRGDAEGVLVPAMSDEAAATFRCSAQLLQDARAVGLEDSSLPPGRARPPPQCHFRTH